MTAGADGFTDVEAIPASRDRSGLSYSGLVTEVVSCMGRDSEQNKQPCEGTALHNATMKP